MNSLDPQASQDALREASEAFRQGARVAARPAWYPSGLGLSLAAALASFAVPWLTITGVVLGGVIAPILLEQLARRCTGASPAKNYFAPGARVATVVFVIVAAALCTTGLALLKTTGEPAYVLVAAVALGIVTTVCTWQVGRSRLSAPGADPAPR